MKLKVLGCGTSTGVPIPGCRCAVCTSNDPKNNRSRTSSVVLTDDGKHILIDATTDFRYQALAADLRYVHAVLYTHGHSDHILGTDDLRAYNFVQKAPIPCYGSKQTLGDLEEFFAYIFKRDPKWEGGMLADLRLHTIDEDAPFNLFDTRITPFRLIHGTTPVTGYRFGELAYATDCKVIPPDSMETLRGIKYLLLDGLRYEPHPTHFNIPEAIEIAESLEVEMTYLIHTTHSVDYTETNRKLPSNIQLAYDGLEIEFRGEPE